MKKPKLPTFGGWGIGCCKSNAEVVASNLYDTWEKYHKQEMDNLWETIRTQADRIQELTPRKRLNYFGRRSR